MIHEIIFDVISAWQVIAAGLAIMIILPVIFYFASFDKKPVKIKRVPMINKGKAQRKKGKARAARDEPENGNYEEEND